MADFQTFVDRRGTHAEKYALRKTLFGSEDVLPMWVADMDLPTPAFIREAIAKRLEHPILGYTEMPDTLYQAIIDWQAQYDYRVTANQIVFTHNVANGFFMAVQAFSKSGDAILVQPPIYPPFLNAPVLNDRQTVEAHLCLEDGRYEIDFDTFEQTIILHQVTLFLFCNPQNPSGRVWLKEELQRLADICIKHNVIMVSDEIHSDMTYAPNQHIPLASLSKEVAQHTITLNSPGKTFNLGGLHIGYALIANPKLKAQYLKVAKSNSIQDLNLFGMIALQAAYTAQGKAYRDELNQFLTNNINQFCDFMAKTFPDVNVMKPEASYLVWIDFSAMFNTQKTIKKWLTQYAKLGLNDGESFGAVGTGFMRLNLAVPPQTLQKALTQLKQAKNKL